MMSKPFIAEPEPATDPARDGFRERPLRLATTEPAGTGTPAAETKAAFDPSKSYREIRAAFEGDFERAYVAWLLGRHGGNISAAAREARMDRKYLYDLARKHGLRSARSTA